MPAAFIIDHPEKIRDPLVERPVVGILLAFMAGSLNAWTLPNAQTFATVQSGNVVQSGYWLVQGDWEKFSFPFLSVLAFGLGSAFCGILMTTILKRGEIFTPVVLFLQAVLLVALAVAAHAWFTGSARINPHYVAYGISFVAGMQGNAFHKNHGMLYGNVAVTFVVQMAFNFLVQGLFRRTGINGEPNLMWSGLFFLVLLGFAAGGGIGFLIGQYVLSTGAVLLPALLAFTLGAIAVKDALHREAVDPSAGGTFA